MSGSAFLDTNVLIYLYSQSEPDKRQRAEAAAAQTDAWISTQVLSELANVLRKRFRLEYPLIQAAIEEQITAFQVATVTPDTIRRALHLAEAYRYSYYDSLILAAALEAGCAVLYTEDMQHGQRIESGLVIRNPFIDPQGEV